MLNKKLIILLLTLLLQFPSIAAERNAVDTTIKNEIAWDELNPRAIGFVKDYLAIHKERLTKMKTWGAPYFLSIENILKRYHLPTSLKYLAVIESDLKTTALSSAGAVGPWQLMPGTARDLGLTVVKGRDDRTDLSKSTHAAARFLSILYEQLGDWLLVVAAYNGGPARLDNIIKRNDKKNFWDIQQDLPAESRNHVKKFIATHYIFEGKGSETTGILPNESVTVLSKEELNGLDSLTINGRYIGEVIADQLEIEWKRFEKWNPLFNEKVSSAPYTLKLPKEKKAVFEIQHDAILKRSVQYQLEEGTKEITGFPIPTASPRAETPAKTEKKKKTKQ
ncbi:MAG: lytic transglycosylase domain-containing protein [Bacteroidota bacterium]|jgi:membrane-bound lytic murein transglycosylase D